MQEVLDACCGAKMFWFDANDERALFVDKRRYENEIIWTDKKKSKVRTIDVMPNIIADFQKLPFANESFWHVVFDPPHLVRAGDNSWMKKKYGVLPKDWKSLLKKGFDECWRVLKTHGTLIFKWNATQIPVLQVIEVINKKPLYGNKCGKQSKTHWMAFIKEGK